jgi:hypothetical protein
MDLELVGKRRARAREAPGEDTGIRALLCTALPGDDEVAVGVHRHCGQNLGPGGIGIDLKLAGQGSARAREAASENAIEVPVLAVAVPGDDEAAVDSRR